MWQTFSAFAGANRFSPCVDADWNFVNSSRPFAVRSLHDRDVRPYPLAAHDAVCPPTLDDALGLLHESELAKKLDRRREVVNHDANVFYPFDTHGFNRDERD
jgi:hypothetical protein